MMNQKKVIIIGNGFDKNLGLPTGYDDFMKSDYFGQLLKTGNSVAQHLSGVRQLERWVDIENEIGEIGENRTSKISFEEYDALANSLCNYLKMIDTSTFREDSSAYIFLKKILNSEFKESFLIVDFNYTDSVEKILLHLGVPKDEIKNKLKKVHGELNKKNIIFGVEDDRDLKKGCDFLRKSTAKDYSGVVDVSRVMIEATEVDVFGSSLGITDMDHFSRYFLAKSNQQSNQLQKFNLYYHIDESLRQLEERITELTLKQKNKFKKNITYDSILVKI